MLESSSLTELFQVSSGRKYLPAGILLVNESSVRPVSYVFLAYRPNIDFRRLALEREIEDKLDIIIVPRLAWSINDDNYT
jgi:hypothetical protein